MEKDLELIRYEIAAMAGTLFDVIGISFEETSELERQVLATFAFGMIFAVGQLNHLSPPEIHALTISCLMDVFSYAPQQAGVFSEMLIQHVSSKDPTNTHTAIAHRGIDGHYQWQEKQTDQLRDNINGILEILGA